MKAKDSFTVEKVKELKKLHGHCRLEMLDGSGKVIKSQEHDNIVTPWIANAINKGNFFDSIPSNKEFPLTNWFSGVILLDKNADATKMTIPSDAHVTACASNTSGSDSTDLRRGNYNPDSSYPIVENGRVTGYRFVWYWSDTRGNNSADTHIKAVCLTRPELAIARYGDTMPDDTVLSEKLVHFEPTENLAKCQIIDYENECAFFVDVSGGKINITQYQLDTKQYHILGVFNDSDVYDVTRVITTQEITPQTAIANFSYQRASVSYVSGIIHVLEWQNNTATVIDHAIDPSDWSEASTSYTYSLDTNVYIYNSAFNEGSIIPKDYILYTSGYLWLVGTDKNFYKCSLSNVADVTEFDSVANSDVVIRGVFAELPNGDWIKYGYGEDNVARAQVNYYHDGEVYGAYDVYDAPAGYGAKYRAVNFTGYGTMIISQPHVGRYNTANYMALYLPAFSVATVWNINDDDHTKTVGLTMRVIYEITEDDGE